MRAAAKGMWCLLDMHGNSRAALQICYNTAAQLRH